MIAACETCRKATAHHGNRCTVCGTPDHQAGPRVGSGPAGRQLVRPAACSPQPLAAVSPWPHPNSFRSSPTHDLYATEPDDADAITQQLVGFFHRSNSDYEIVEKIGKGGMGAVYLATQKKLGRKVAIKVMSKKSSFKRRHKERFSREARALACLEHPAIIPIYDLFEVEGMLCIAMGFAGGGSLRELLRSRGALEESFAAKVGMQASLGLWAAAKKGIVHRDIKPDNLLITESGDIKIADFGLVSDGSTDSAHLTMDGTLLGTPAYMSPEQFRDSRSADHRSDLYSLGCTLYELLAGKPPFAGPAAINYLEQHVHRAPDLQAIRASVSMRQVLAKLLAKIPDQRYCTGEEAARDLAVLAGASSSSSGTDWALGHLAEPQTQATTPTSALSGGGIFVGTRRRRDAWGSSLSPQPSNTPRSLTPRSTDEVTSPPVYRGPLPSDPSAAPASWPPFSGTQAAEPPPSGRDWSRIIAILVIVALGGVLGFRLATNSDRRAEAKDGEGDFLRDPWDSGDSREDPYRERFERSEGPGRGAGPRRASDDPADGWRREDRGSFGGDRPNQRGYGRDGWQDDGPQSFRERKDPEGNARRAKRLAEAVERRFSSISEQWNAQDMASDLISGLRLEEISRSAEDFLASGSYREAAEEFGRLENAWLSGCRDLQEQIETREGDLNLFREESSQNRRRGKGPGGGADRGLDAPKKLQKRATLAFDEARGAYESLSVLDLATREPLHEEIDRAEGLVKDGNALYDIGDFLNAERLYLEARDIFDSIRKKAGEPADDQPFVR